MDLGSRRRLVDHRHVVVFEGAECRYVKLVGATQFFHNVWHLPYSLVIIDVVVVSVSSHQSRGKIRETGVLDEIVVRDF